MAELFIELLSEEIPAKLQIDARQKIKQIIEERLKKEEINFKTSKSFSTPKRLVFFIDGIPEKIEQKKKVIKGPKIDVPQVAIDGFIKSNNLNKSDLYKKNLEKGEFYFAETKPDKAEIDRRLKTYWLPYHDKITAALSDIKKEYGYVVLFDCHSIKSVVPRFFQGTLPDFNLGTSSGESCAASLRDTLATTLSEDTEHSLAVDGRFKGGYITRHYGDPAHNVHAFQLELSLATYMNEEPAMSDSYTHLTLTQRDLV